MFHLQKVLLDYLPDDHSRQVTSQYYVEHLLNQENNIQRVMDLGCGAGNSLDYFRKKEQDIQWVGVDIEKSPEVEGRTREGGEFYTFDGIHIPFDDNHFDLIYSNQVLEHVRYPEKLLKEVHRVLNHDRYFIGSTSHLEPYHSYSIWNCTPYGFSLVLKEAGFKLIEIRPSVDFLLLAIRRMLGSPKIFSYFWKKETPLNMGISLCGKVMRKDNAWVNAVKLQLCGQFSFLACKL